MKRRDDLRRKNVLLGRLHDEAAGALLVRVIGPADIVCGRQLLALVGRWLVDAKDERPLCLCCDFEWSPRGGLLPLHFVAVVPRGASSHTIRCCAGCAALHGPSGSPGPARGVTQNDVAGIAQAQPSSAGTGACAMSISIITVLTAEKPTHACISTLGDDPPKCARYSPDALSRSHDNLVKTYAIVLDDIGTAENSKVAPERIKLRPSWRLEISPLNCQWGYLLEKGGIQPDVADALIKALIKAGLSDKGAGGANRLMRLPGSVVNGFAARLHEWNPELRYSRTDIAVGLGVECVQ
jgi:hypothetical protein